MKFFSFLSNSQVLVLCLMLKQSKLIKNFGNRTQCYVIIAKRYRFWTPYGECRITLKKGEKFNELIFEDTAKGISTDALPKLFTRFSTTCRGGTGMGLAFCKMVMQEYGGDIICESELGKYTRFILTFPTIIVE